MVVSSAVEWHVPQTHKSEVDDVTASVSCACAVHVCELVNLDIISVNYLHILVDYMYICGVSKKHGNLYNYV